MVLKTCESENTMQILLGLRYVTVSWAFWPSDFSSFQYETILIYANQFSFYSLPFLRHSPSSHTFPTLAFPFLLKRSEEKVRGKLWQWKKNLPVGKNLRLIRQKTLMHRYSRYYTGNLLLKLICIPLFKNVFNPTLSVQSEWKFTWLSNHFCWSL